MDFKEQFDRPLPVINKDKKEIYVETPGNYNGKLFIKNDGGGILSGRIMSNSGAITFEPEDFSGNNNEISFHIDTGMYAVGDILRTNAVILSNGGEHSIDFIVKIIPYAIETKENIKITGLDEFFSYTDNYPESSKALFGSHEFMIWLRSSGYEFMELYEKFVDDSNKERALENFLIFNGYKQKTDIFETEGSINISLPPFSKEVYAGSVALTKKDSDFVDLNMSVKNNSPWLKLEKERLTSIDFDESLTVYVNFFIDPAKIERKTGIDIISIGGREIIVTALKMNYIETKLEKEYISTKDESYLLIKNNSGSRLTVDILPKDSFLKFESSRYFVKEHAKIPFKVELSAIQAAQMGLLKQPEIKTSIIVDTVFNKKTYVKKLELTIGNF